MKKTLGLCLIAATLTACSGGDQRHVFLIQDALKSPLGQETVDPAIALEFGRSSGTPIQQGLISNKKTNAVNKSAEEACQIAFLSAVKQFQETARNNNAAKVSNLVSYFKRNTHTSTTHYECYVGNLMAGVALKGDIVR